MSDNRVVLLTGATGFIGAWIARVLVAHRYDVVALVRPKALPGRLADVADRVRFAEGDFHDAADMDRVVSSTRPEVLIHAAWHAAHGPYLADPRNIDDLQASLDLFERVRRAGCRRIVGIGTCLEYDTQLGWLDESAPLRPTSLYAAAKAALFLATRAWANELNVSFAWPRLFYQYGPGEDRRRLVPAVTTSLLASVPVQVTQGDQVRDYLFVDDVAHAVAAIALSEVEGAINVGSGVPIRVREMISAIERRLDRPGLVQFGGRADDPDDPPFICANTARLRNELGWQSTTSLEAGIAQTVAWWACQANNK